ncbi:VOC family protein [Pseudoxanthomonas sp. J35]|uniref:VOC family protein n=1 Tax=Pseudoxanthomonas sp. J35 TaxID=935852 RepID=UPI00048F848F|nr:VOC family protein [Pseudoxanthomonas sp. J35]
MNLERLVPMQPVSDLEAAVAFYGKLGFRVEQRDDGLGWARLRCGRYELMLDRSIGLHPGIPRTAVLYLYPEDVVEFHPPGPGKRT